MPLNLAPTFERRKVKFWVSGTLAAFVGKCTIFTRKRAKTTENRTKTGKFCTNYGK